MPYGSYVLAEELLLRVLAVLTTAMFLAEYAFDADDVMTRLAGHTGRDVVDTLVTGVAFGLVGSGTATRSARPPDAGPNCSAGARRSPAW